MNSLIAFEAVARHGSMTHAAAELYVTHSAVSRHISQLEDYFCARLFERKGRSIQLTRQGAIYAAELKSMFDGLEVATQASFDSRTSSTTLQINLPPSFATHWMASRLERFTKEYPQISFQLNTVHDLFPADFERTNVDFSVCVGDGKWPRLRLVPLFDELLIPVCSPTFADRIKHVDDLKNLTLLHSQQREHEWELWLKAVGATAVDPQNGLRMGNSHIAIQAALHDLGVTIVQANYVSDYLKQGRLIAPFADKLLSTGHVYYAAYAEKQKPAAKIIAFRSWIEKEAAHCQKELAKLYGAPNTYLKI